MENDMMPVWDVLADFVARATRSIRGSRQEDDYDDRLLDNVSLDDGDWRSLQFLGRSSRDLEPLSASLNFVVATRLLEMRLAERGRINVSDEAYPMGYRITALGKAVLKRGQRARYSN